MGRLDAVGHLTINKTELQTPSATVLVGKVFIENNNQRVLRCLKVSGLMFTVKRANQVNTGLGTATLLQGLDVHTIVCHGDCHC